MLGDEDGGDAVWQRAANGLPQSTLAHAPEWRTVIRRAYGHKPIYLVAEDEEGRAGVLPAFLVRRPVIGTVAASMPFLDAGGPCAGSAALAQALVERLLTEALRIADSGQIARFTAARIMDDNRRTWWDVSVTPLHIVDNLPGHYLVMSRDITPEVEDGERQSAVTAEMRHRLKNTLGLAAGLIVASARDRDDCHEFAGEVIHRLAQLASAQELIFGTYPVKCFSQVLTLLGAAYFDCGLELGEVPQVQLPDRSVQALALVFGELATNSVKYGAFKQGGRVCVSGEIVGTLLKTRWREETRFGPQRRGGQGLKLLDRIVRSSGGMVNRVFEPEIMTTEVYLPYVE